MGGGVAFHNSRHRLALGHVNEMRPQEKVHSRGSKVAYRAKTHIFFTQRYTAGILYTDSLDSA